MSELLTLEAPVTGYEMPERQESFGTEVDLASRWLGGSVLAASDESFGEKEALLTPTPSAFVPGNYGPRGEIVDGWETKRRREPGHDWALIRLGAAGIITWIDVDTSCFTGNFPTTCRIEACGVEGFPSPAELNDPGTEWIEIVPRAPLAGDTHNRFPVTDPRRFTHVRLSAYPDGGIARLRVYGHVVPDPRLFDGLTIDLASQDHGGQVVTSSDGFYTSAAMLNRPDKARTMGEGWETRRRRDDGNDHAIIRLALPGHIQLVEIDTAHFKYNASAEITLVGAALGDDPTSWRPLLPRKRLQPDTRHVFRVAPNRHPWAQVRLDAFPDGGISRVRLWGHVDRAARREAGVRWFNSLLSTQAMAVLLADGHSAEVADVIVKHRPLDGSSLVASVERFASQLSEVQRAVTLAKLEEMLGGT